MRYLVEQSRHMPKTVALGQISHHRVGLIVAHPHLVNGAPAKETLDLAPGHKLIGAQNLFQWTRLLAGFGVFGRLVLSQSLR